jgi:hypothetical protein
MKSRCHSLLFGLNEEKIRNSPYILTLTLGVRMPTTLRNRRFYAHPSDCDGLHPLDSTDGVWRSYLQSRSHLQHYGITFLCFAVEPPCPLTISDAKRGK